MYDISGCSSQGKIDDLVYTYASNSNQLLNVSDNAPSSSRNEGFKNTHGSNYQYDNNGNLTLDQDKQITITYNHLNLPTVISKIGTSIRLELQYSADGSLLNRIEYNASTEVEKRDYIAGIEYVDGIIESIGHAQGRVYYTNGTSPRYEYTINDHLGNARVMYSDLNGNGKIEDESEILWEGHYYPFGLGLHGPWMDRPEAESNYKYNGIEQIDNFDLGVNMAFYRTLDPAIGRWWQVDPKAEAGMSHSPYNAMWNNPVSYSDPNGDLAFLAALGYAAVSVTANGIINEARGGSFFDGAAGAAFAGAFTGGIGSAIGAGVSGHLPSANIGLGGGLNLSISPALAFGNGGIGVGYNAGVSFSSGGFSGGINFGGSYFGSGIGTGKAGFESRVGVGVGYQTGDFSIQLGKNHFGSGETSQTTGFAQVGYKDWSFNFDNDILGDGGDRYRSAGVQLNYKDYTVFGLNMFTGDPGLSSDDRNIQIDPATGEKTYYKSVNGDNPNKYRYTNMYVGYKGYRAGYGSEGIRNFWQNEVIHKRATHSPFFKIIPGSPSGFQFGRYTKNPYTIW